MIPARLTARRKASRKTPKWPSHMKRHTPDSQLEHLGDCYTTASCRRAIHRACERAGVEKWSPNRLRHTYATEIRKLYGLEDSKAMLGHTKVTTTQIYAEQDAERRRRIARKVG